MEIPYSAQDIAKALNEIFRLFDNLAKRSGKVLEIYKGRKRRKAAQWLDNLRFQEGGSMSILRRLSGGDYTKEDIEALRAQLMATERGVSEAISLLLKYKRRIREQLNIESAILLEEIIEGENGKNNIRSLLRFICNAPQWGKESVDRVQGAAIRAIRKIETLNKNIIDLHNSLLTTKTSRKRPTKGGARSTQSKGKKAKASSTG